MRTLVALVALAACSPDRGPSTRPAGNPTPRAGGTLTFALPTGVISLDPAYGYDDASQVPQRALFDTLIDYGPDGALEPHLADALPARSADGTSYTFHLRADAAYADGTPVVAEDLRYQLERVRALADSPYQSFLANVTAIAAPDPRTLVIALAAPDAAFLGLLTLSFATPQRRAHVTAAGDALRRTPLGTGPYRLVAWDEGERLVLAKNPHARVPGRGYLDTLVLRENVPADVQFLAFERGELDTLTHPTAPDHLWLLRAPAWRPYLRTRTTLTAYGSRMVVTTRPFDDVRVRRALNYAVDKAHAVKLLHGDATPAHGVLPPGVPGRDDALVPYPHDVARARALLAEAGYPHGFDVDYVIPVDDEAELLAASLQADLAEVGVRLRIVRLAFAAYADAVARPAATPFAKVGWIGDTPDAAGFLDAKFHSRGIAAENATNDAAYANPALDVLLDAARATPDPAARAALYRRAERIVYDDAPWIWEYHQQELEVVQPYVRLPARSLWSRDYTRAWLDVGPDGRPLGATP